MDNFAIKFIEHTLNKKDENDLSMNDAIQTIYDYDEEIELTWGNEKVNLYVKGDVSVSWLDIIRMIENLGSREDFYMHWPSESFWVTWKFIVNGDSFKIETIGSKNIPMIEVSKKQFISEWDSFIAKINKDLIKQGYDLSKLDLYP